MDYKWYNLNAPNAGDLDYKWYSLSGIQANLDYKQLQPYECPGMGAKLGTVTVGPGCFRLHNSTHWQDITGTIQPCQAKEGGCTEKIDHGLISIEHLALWDRNVHPKGAVLYIMVKYHC